MWFAKLFGGRDDGSDDELPTAVAPPPPALTAPTAAAPQPAEPVSAASAKAPKGKGFDPYNSGTFERQNAWERIGRR